MASVRQLTGSRYQVEVTGPELALMRAALGDAERVSRRREETEELAMAEASLPPLADIRFKRRRRAASSYLA